MILTPVLHFAANYDTERKMFKIQRTMKNYVEKKFASKFLFNYSSL